MNNYNGTTISETTSEDSRAYMHTFLFPTSSEQTTVKAKSKRGVPKLKGILKNHNAIVPVVSLFDPWCDGKEVDKIYREDVLYTVRKPFYATYREIEAEQKNLLNTPGGVFKNKGLLYAFHIHHCKAVPVDKPVRLQWNLNQTEQHEVSTLLFARALREDPYHLGINKPTRNYEANIGPSITVTTTNTDPEEDITMICN
jgi:hypothetical protein